MFASLVMSTRGRPLQVWLGAAAAFAVHVAIAVTIGVALFHLLPHRVLEIIVAAMFAIGGVLALREAMKQRQEEELVEKEAASHRRVAVTAFLVIFLAEWGDLTQILTANLAAHYHDPLSVAVGARAGAVGRGWAGRRERSEPAARGEHRDGAHRHRRRALRSRWLGGLRSDALNSSGAAARTLARRSARGSPVSCSGEATLRPGMPRHAGGGPGCAPRARLRRPRGRPRCHACHGAGRSPVPRPP